jgi:hypothetical protein
VTALGVYGYRVEGLDAAADLLQPVPAGDRRLVIKMESGPPATGRAEVSDRAARIPLVGGALLELERGSRSVRLQTPSELPPGDVVHPWLVPAVSVFASWDGLAVVHAGVVVKDSKALVVVGAREAGKSSLMAHFALRGDVEVYADDLMVTDGRRTWPGPRCLDLRTGSLGLVGAAERTTSSRAGERHRMVLPPTSPEAVLCSVALLGWSDDLHLERVSASTLIREVVPEATHGTATGDGLLPLLGLSAWRLQRPRDWARMSDAAEQLIRTL